jgi:hypothetical protein
MANETKKSSKWTKVGAILKTDPDKGAFIVLGNANSKNEKYRTTVELVVKDANGNVVAKSTNGFLTIQDPRKRVGASEADLEKISPKLKSELFIVEKSE